MFTLHRNVRLKVHFTSTDPARAGLGGQSDELQPGPETLGNWRPGGYQAYEPSDDPASADVIVFIEPNYFKNWKYVPVLAAHPLLRRYPAKCFTITTDDSPVGLLPGVYASMPADRWEPNRFRAGCYLFQPNRFVPIVAAERDERGPKLLYSFRGFASSAVRRRMFASQPLKQKGSIVQTFGWCDHTDEQKKEFLREILDSKFVLCPGGLAPATHRLFECMELGRVPVVLSEQWMAPQGVAWNDCSLRIAENQVDALPDILEAFAPMAAEMGRMARQEWERRFAPKIRLGGMVQAIEDLLLINPAPADAEKMIERWSSWRYRYRQGWTFPQRIIRSAGNGRLRDKAKNMLRGMPSKPNSDAPWQP